MPKPLHRRTFLRGLAGTAIALPFLEAMLPRRASAADGSPCRYVGMFGGIEQLQCIPSSTGPGYAMPAGLASLEPVREHVSIVSGLEIATGSPTPPPGGRTNPHHGNIMMPLLTGFRSSEDNYGVPHSASADQIVADVHGTDSHFTSLEFRAQPKGYRGGSSGVGAQMSYRAGGGANVPQVSPQLAFESIFSGFVPDTADPADLEAKQKLLARRLSVLDLVQGRGAQLMNRVGSQDRIRLERHFDEIRDLEHRIADIPDLVGGACAVPDDPGPDPSQEDFSNPEHGGTAGYSDEDKRASVFVELVHMALTCDLTRVATIMLTNEQCLMSVEPLFGELLEVHDVTHVDFANRNTVWNAITSWHAGFFAQLVQRLADTPEPTGGTMLDTTVLVHTNSGGPSGHGGSNMAMVVAGAPSKLVAGVHVEQPNGHPAHVYQTALHALGIEQDFGEVPGLVDGLLA